MMRSLFYMLTTMSLAYSLFSCEEPYTPPSVFDEAEIVVEGYVQQGDQAIPPYVILTKSTAYSTFLSTDALSELFVHNAEVRISDGDSSILLTEVCLSDLAQFDSSLVEAFVNSIGIPASSLSDLPNFCVYIDFNAFSGQSILRIEAGRTYSLSIQTEDNKQLSAQSTLMRNIPVDTIFYVDHPTYPQNDSLVEIRMSFADPASEQNYYRLFSKRNQERMFPATTKDGTGLSVSTDAVFNGQSFVFPVQRGQDPLAPLDFETFGYFWRGDTITIRGINLDYPQYKFWQTLEFNTGAQGPFASYTRVQSNIEGGLGIFGAYSFKDYSLIIPQ